MALRTTDTHTDFTSASGTASANSTYTDYYAWKVFDKLSELGAIWATNGTGLPAWVQYEFSTRVSISSIGFSFGSPEAQAPVDYAYQVSDNGVDWTTIHAKVGEVYAGDYLPASTATISPEVEANFFRMFISANGGDASYTAVGDIVINYEEVPPLLTNDTDPFGDGSLVAGYNLDSSGNDYVGTKHGIETSVTYTPSPLNSEAVFDGTNSEIDIDAYSETLVSSTIPFSISLFVTLNQLKGQNFISFGGATNGFTVCQFEDNSIGFAGNDTDINTQAKTDVIATTSVRYHMVISRIGTGATYNVFIDGILKLSAVTVNFADGGNTDTIGGHETEIYKGVGTGIDSRLDGRLDQVMFFNREIVQYEVDALYAMEAEAVVPVGLAIFFNGIETTQVFFNGTELTEAYFNGTLLT